MSAYHSRGADAVTTVKAMTLEGGIYAAAGVALGLHLLAGA
jgi:hypothetical protein